MEFYERELYESFFNKQINTLKERNCPEEIVNLLAYQWRNQEFVRMVSKIELGEGNIPCLPVIPRTYRSPYDLMSMVWKSGNQGSNPLCPTGMTDQFKTPDGPYWIFDVEDGESTLNKSSKDAEKIFKEQSRSPLTIAEGIALTTHTDVLSRHFVIAAGSYYDHTNTHVEADGHVDYIVTDKYKKDGVLSVDLNGGSPNISWDDCTNYSHPKYGSPSCGSRSLIQ